MMQLHEKETGVFVGTITDAQVQFLIDHLEEESADDTDSYIDHATLDLFEEVGAEADVLALLRQALGTRDGIEIVWSTASRRAAPGPEQARISRGRREG
jgi:processive 1,2-diacylglycerol beta-glucosyltransferase